MNAVMIIPTGLGCAIGGHAGDAGAVAKLLASCCDTLVTHPNVLNASDINEKPENCWYVDGYLLDQFLEGRTGLSHPRHNRILLAVNKPVLPQTINSVNAARHTLGAHIEIMPLKTPLVMKAKFRENGSAGGDIEGVAELVHQARTHQFEALAVQSVVNVSQEVAFEYLRKGGINPWGGVEAELSRMLGAKLRCPVAHAPMDSGVFDKFNEVVPSRMAAELVSVSYLHCVLKGLHDAPRPATGQRSFCVSDIDVMISPWNCWGIPHRHCQAAGIPIISVKENPVVAIGDLSDAGRMFAAENYLEAAGMLMAKRARVSIESVRGGDLGVILNSD